MRLKERPTVAIQIQGSTQTNFNAATLGVLVGIGSI